MKTPSPGTFRSVAFWQKVWIVSVIATAIILASMALVTFRNRDRGATDAVIWAIQDLDAAPDSAVAPVYNPGVFDSAVAGFLQAVKDGKIPVDTVRAFYHAYSLGARDGEIDPVDIVSIGPYLGLPRRALPPPAPDSTAAQETDRDEDTDE